MQSFVRGAERPIIGCIIETVTNVFMGLPFGYYMAFNRGWGVQGLWAGMLLTYIANILFYQIVICSINWPATVQKS